MAKASGPWESIICFQPFWQGCETVNGVTCGILEDGLDDLALELGLTDLALDAAAVDGNVAEVGEQLLGTVLRADQSEELGGVVDECGPAGTIDEDGVAQQGSEERNVGLDTADTELNKSTQHLAAHNLVSGATACALDQHGVIVRGDDGTSETVTTVQTNTVTTGRAVDLDLTGVGGGSPWRGPQ